MNDFSQIDQSKKENNKAMLTKSGRKEAAFG
jgi:hypothetical protein